MATDDLKQTLMSLHAQLASGAQIDPELQDLLRLLDADIRSRLSPTDAIASAGGIGATGLTNATNAADATEVFTAGQTTAGPHAAGSAAATRAAQHDALPAEDTTVQPTSAGVGADAGGRDKAPRGLGARAQEISARFAAAHPALEPVLRELTDTLQRIGI